MTITNSPWYHPEPRRSALHLDVVPVDVVHALAAEDAAALSSPFVTPYLAGPECRSLWRYRSGQLRETPSDAPWVTRSIMVPDVASPVGVAGFHGAPDAAGTVEIGYRVDPAHRRHGHARGALETMIAVGRRHPDVRTVRATISPDNAASRALVGGYGFVEVGEQWDDEDGLEIVYEVSG